MKNSEKSAFVVLFFVCEFIIVPISLFALLMFFILYSPGERFFVIENMLISAAVALLINILPIIITLIMKSQDKGTYQSLKILSKISFIIVYLTCYLLC